MELTNIIFLFFVLPIFFLTCYLVPEKFKNFAFLLISFFCLFWVYKSYAIDIFLIGLINYIFGYFIDKTKREKSRKLIFIFFVIVLVDIFFSLSNNFWFSFELTYLFSVFKYFPLFFLLLNNIIYLLDIYVGKARFRRNFVDYFLYIFMFPKFLLGPFVPYNRMEDFFLKKKITTNGFFEGVKFLIFGLFEVSILAYEIGQVIKFVFFRNVRAISLVCSWLGVFSVFMYIYFNLAGYNYMAIGFLKMMGFFNNFKFARKISYDGVLNFFNRFFIASFNKYFKLYVSKIISYNKKNIKPFVNNILYLIFCFFIFGLLTNFLIGFYITLFIILRKVILRRQFFIKIPDFIKKIISFIYILFLTFSFFINRFTDNYIFNYNLASNFIEKYFFALFFGNAIFIEKSFVFFVVVLRFFGAVFLYFITKYYFRWFEKIEEVNKRYYLFLLYFSFLSLFIISILYCLNL